MSYQINLGQWNSVFAVPSALVDKHIKLASEAQLKVILYLLRHSGEEITSESLTKALSISLQELDNAIDFWKERGLITERGAYFLPVVFKPTEGRCILV